MNDIQPLAFELIQLLDQEICVRTSIWNASLMKKTNDVAEVMGHLVEVSAFK